jgi:putative transposase
VAKTQTLSFPIRLPDAMQAEALRLLDASTIAINRIITDLWPHLDLFVADRSGPAWKQVEKHLLHRTGHGNRQERCEMEQAGRILRAQASRVAVLDVMLEVAAKYGSPLEQESRVLGWDWGVRSLITVSILEKPEGDEPYRQVSRPVFLDTGSIDGRQARLRREIDRLKACREHYDTLIKQALSAHTQQHRPLPPDFPRWNARVSDYEARIKQCWKKYERRNRELAHLASNLLILLALLHDCRLICGENLTTLKTEGRGRGVRGRFRNWRTNTTVRGELWRVLKYKCHLLGIRARQVDPRGTTHTCPRCHQPAKTFLSSAPADRTKAIEWGAWLCCSNPACLWNGARDYAASLNIARLGLAFLSTYHETKRTAWLIPQSSQLCTSGLARRCCCRRRG